MPVDGLDRAIEVFLELPGQARLADARRPGHGHEPGATVAAGGDHQVLQQAHLLFAPNEGRFGQLRAALPATLGHHAQRPPGRHRCGLALEELLAGLLEGDGQGRRAIGRLAHEHRPGRRDRLQARRRVHEVPCNEALIGGPERDGGLAAQDAGPGLDALPQEVDCVDQLERGAHGPLGVILARDRRAPHGHHRVTDELLERASVAGDHVARQLEVTRQGLAHVLRVALLGEGREADQVREEHRHEAPFGERAARASGGHARSRAASRGRPACLGLR